MNKNDALKQHDALQHAAEAGSKLFFSGRALVSYGIMLLLIPVIERLSHGLTLGIEILRQDYINIVAHILFYWLIVRAIARFHFNRRERTANPAIRSVLNIIQPILVALFGAIFALSMTGHGAMTAPIIALFLGIMFNILGQFTRTYIVIFSWSLIALGLALLALADSGIDWLWMIFTTYTGCAYIIIGGLIKL